MQKSGNSEILSNQRISSLTDGVFSIAMTLMVFDLKTPENIPYNLASEELTNILIGIIPDVEAYIVSFIILGIIWLRHQIQLNYLQSADRGLILYSIIFLLLVGLVPFSVGLMIRYNDFQLPFIIYASNLLAISIVMFLQWRYVSNDNKLISKDLDKKIIKIYSRISFVPILIFLISIPVSFYSVRAALFVIWLDPLFYIFNKSLRTRFSKFRR